jgi:L-lactate utilization protein LutC
LSDVPLREPCAGASSTAPIAASVPDVSAPEGQQLAIAYTHAYMGQVRRDAVEQAKQDCAVMRTHIGVPSRQTMNDVMNALIREFDEANIM